jgi:hypothetical protein
MKAFLLTAATFLAFAGSVFAQNLPPDYNWEVGINGGVSGFTRPLGPANTYQGTRTHLVSDFSLRLNYFFSPNWMINLDLGSRRWASYGDWQMNGLYGQELQKREITFLVADRAINEAVAINYVIPFYTRYNNYNKANLNFGALFGMMTTVNDGSLAYSKYRGAPDSNLLYMSRYDYGFGIGFTYGVQMGFTYFLMPRLGLNADFGVRYASVKTNDEHYGGINNSFYLLYFPATLGVRWRF